MAVAEAMATVSGAAQNLVLLQVDVDRMLPVIPRVLENPVFRAVLFDRESQLITVREPVIDDPLTIVAVETEVSRDPRGDDTWQLA